MTLKIIFILSLLLIGVSLYFLWRKHQSLLTGRLTQGEVTQLIAVQGAKGGVSYKLEVSYQKPDGTPATFITSFATSPPLHNVGEKVPVDYYANGKTPDILGFADLFLLQWIGLSLGFSLLFFSLGMFLGPWVVRTLYLNNFALKWG